MHMIYARILLTTTEGAHTSYFARRSGSYFLRGLLMIKNSYVYLVAPVVYLFPRQPTYYVGSILQVAMFSFLYKMRGVCHGMVHICLLHRKEAAEDFWVLKNG